MSHKERNLFLICTKASYSHCTCLSIYLMQLQSHRMHLIIAGDVISMIEPKSFGLIFQALQSGPSLPSQFYLSLIASTHAPARNIRHLLLLHTCPHHLPHCGALAKTPCGSLCLGTGPFLSPTANPVHFSGFSLFYINRSILFQLKEIFSSFELS